MEQLLLAIVAGFIAGMIGAQSVIWSWRKTLKYRASRR